MIFCEGWTVMTETIVIPSPFKSYVCIPVLKTFLLRKFELKLLYALSFLTVSKTFLGKFHLKLLHMESWFDLKCINHFERHSLSMNSFHRNEVWFILISNLENLAKCIISRPGNYKRYILKGFQVNFEISKIRFIVWNVINLFEISKSKK